MLLDAFLRVASDELAESRGCGCGLFMLTVV